MSKSKIVKDENRDQKEPWERREVYEAMHDEAVLIIDTLAQEASFSTVVEEAKRHLTVLADVEEDRDTGRKRAVFKREPSEGTAVEDFVVSRVIYFACIEHLSDTLGWWDTQVTGGLINDDLPNPWRDGIPGIEDFRGAMRLFATGEISPTPTPSQ